MGKKWGKKERAVRNALKELEESGWITVTRQGLGKTNYYKLHVRVEKKGVVSSKES